MTLSKYRTLCHNRSGVGKRTAFSSSLPNPHRGFAAGMKNLISFRTS